MPKHTFSQLKAWTSGDWGRARIRGSVDGFSIDSRTLQKGAMFIALKTEKRDGHAFLKAARDAGAAAALVERRHPSIDLPQLKVGDTLSAFQTIAQRHRCLFPGTVVGITGSCGKTSTKDLLKILLGKRRTHATFSNHNNHLGVPLTLLEIDPQKHRFAVVEMGMNAPGEIARLAELTVPDIALITLVASVHLERLGSLNAIATEKADLARHTQSDGFALFPSDCMQYESFRDFSVPSWVVVPRGEGKDDLPVEKYFEYWAEAVNGTHTVLGIRQQSKRERFFEVPRAGRGMLQNAAMAIVVASKLGVSDTLICKRLKHWLPSPLRGEVLGCGKTLFYVDCYNANPASMIESLEVFNLLFKPQLPRVYVIGSMAELGTGAPEIHFEVGKKLHLRTQDRVVLLGDNAEDLSRGLIEGGSRPQQITLPKSVDEAKVLLSDFHGAVFLKGSRVYALEKLLPENTRPLTRAMKGKKSC